MNRLLAQPTTRWVTLALIFVVGPMMIHCFVLSPSLNRLSDFQNQVKMKAAGFLPFSSGPAPASNQEFEQLEDVKAAELGRFKKVDGSAALLRFSGALADALAADATGCGLQVLSVDMENASINAKYVPANERAMETLEALPGVTWKELQDPLALPMRQLPFIEMRMTVSAEYSRVFSFVESLPEFPVPVSLVSLTMIEDSLARAFCLKIRGYYVGAAAANSQPQTEQAAK